jgi:1,4-dihydroxy-6-naphthoate synthase
MDLSLGFSPCPNDTFLFHALVHGAVAAEGLRFHARLEDVETLNRIALGAATSGSRATPGAADGDAPLDVTKVSYGAVPHLLGEYELLRSGGALGRGCGPLLVARPGTPRAALRRGRIAVPGRHTTANLLLRLWDPELPEGAEMVYSEIMPAVVRGEVDAGLIIHESRFTYPAFGLERVVDLGAWWEAETGLPIPLGGIMARRALGPDTIRAVESAIRESVEHAFAHPDRSAAYVRTHAQEMDERVMREHIALYVNRFSVDLGEEGDRAVRELLRRAEGVVGLPPSVADRKPTDD